MQLTEDEGKSWHNVTPPGMPAWAKVALIEASPFDAGTAYVSVDAHKLGDFKPYIFRTHDFGKTWTTITDGLAAPAYVHAVRSDTVRKGLLFAGTETGVYVSFDDGDHWQSLQLNLPTTSVRDFAVKNGDLVVATHGRSFWILDDITPLRQATAAVAGQAAHLFTPAPAIRFRPGNGQDGHVGVASNPPDGALLDYYLKDDVKGAIALDVYDPQRPPDPPFLEREGASAAAPEVRTRAQAGRSCRPTPGSIASSGTCGMRCRRTSGRRWRRSTTWAGRSGRWWCPERTT